MRAPPHLSWRIRDDADIGQLVSYLHLRAQDSGCTEKAAEAAQRMATGLLEHSGEGLVLTVLAGQGLDLLVTVPKAGLDWIPQVQALTDEFDVHSNPEATQLFCRFSGHTGSAAEPLDVGGLTVALAGEEECGDAWDCLSHSGGVSLILVDGLGHGVGAATAANRALEQFRLCGAQPPSEVIRSLHTALRKTQGAVAAAVTIDRRAGRLTFCGVGNIAARLFGPEGSVGCVSSPGVVGFRLERVRQEAHPWTPTSILVLHTDGLRPVSDPILTRRAPLIASDLYRRFGQNTDDCGVVVVREWDALR